MLVFYIYPVNRPSKFVYILLIFAILFFITHFIFESRSADIFLFISSVVILILLSIFEKKDNSIGTIKFHGQNIIISTEKETKEFDLTSNFKIRINYGGYQHKRMIGDYIPMYNFHAGIDNIIQIETDDKLYKFRFLVESESEELELLEHIRFLQSLNTAIVFNS